MTQKGEIINITYFLSKKYLFNVLCGTLYIVDKDEPTPQDQYKPCYHLFSTFLYCPGSPNLVLHRVPHANFDLWLVSQTKFDIEPNFELLDTAVGML